MPPAPAIKDLSKAVIALVTTGAVVPEGNPDHIETGIATKFGKYSFSKDYGGFHMPRHQMIHGGCDPVYAQEDPNRMIPADVLKDMEAEGKSVSSAILSLLPRAMAAQPTMQLPLVRQLLQSLRRWS